MQLLKIRYLQLRRDLGYWTVLIALAVFFTVREISGLSLWHSLGLAAAVLAWLFHYHAHRRDLDFIHKHFQAPRRDLLITYNLLLLPVSAGLISSGQWLTALGLHGGASLLPLTRKPSRPRRFLFPGRYIPATRFEWISGIRTHALLLLCLSAIACFLSPVKFFGTAALLLLNSVFLGFYTLYEPLIMLNPQQLSPAELLNRKVRYFTRVLLWINLPLLTVNSVFHPETAWFNACFLAGFLLLAASTVYLKYAYYQPRGESRSFHIDSLLLFAACLIPFLLPLSLILNRSHRKKAIDNLSLYTDDHRTH
jgi:hypothetical protein